MVSCEASLKVGDMVRYWCEERKQHVFEPIQSISQEGPAAPYYRLPGARRPISYQQVTAINNSVSVEYN